MMRDGSHAQVVEPNSNRRFVSRKTPQTPASGEIVGGCRLRGGATRYFRLQMMSAAGGPNAART